MEDCYEHLRHEGEEKYSWVWLDSISAFQDIGLDDLWEVIITEKPARKRYGLDKGDYWINMQRLGRWVRDVAALSDRGAFNFGICAWPAELSNSPEDSEVDKKLMPWVQGKNMSMKMCGYVNIVAFGSVTSKGTRRIQLNETERVYAKDQFDCTAKGFMLNPTIPKLMDAIEAARAKRPEQKPTRRRTARRGARRG